MCYDAHEWVYFKIGNLELPSETNKLLHRQHMNQKKKESLT